MYKIDIFSCFFVLDRRRGLVTRKRDGWVRAPVTTVINRLLEQVLFNDRHKVKMSRVFIDDIKMDVSCPSKYDTLRSLHCSMAMANGNGDV